MDAVTRSALRSVASRQPVRASADLSSAVIGWVHEGQDVTVLETRVNPSDHAHVLTLLKRADLSAPERDVWIGGHQASSGAILGWVAATEANSKYTRYPHHKLTPRAFLTDLFLVTAYYSVLQPHEQLTGGIAVAAPAVGQLAMGGWSYQAGPTDHSQVSLLATGSRSAELYTRGTGTCMHAITPTTAPYPGISLTYCLWLQGFSILTRRHGGHRR